MSIFIEKIRIKLSTNSERTNNVIANSLFSAVLKVAMLICSFVMVPITIDYLSKETYGVWMAMTSILNWFVFFDVGLGNGMRNYLSEAVSQGDFIKARSYFSTALYMLSIIAFLLLCVACPLVYLFDINSLLNAYDIDGTYLANVLMIAVVFSLLQFVVKNIGMAYIAMQKYAINDLINFLGTFLALIIVFIITRTTESNLAYVVTSITGIPVIVFIVAAVPLFRKYPQLIPSIRSIDVIAAKKVALKGLGFFAIQITSCLVIFGSANTLISHYCGPGQVTVYNIPYKIFNVLIIGYTIIISPLWNAYTDASTKGDYAWMRSTFRKSIQFWLLSVLGGIFLLSVSGWIIKLWIQDRVEVPFVVSLCVMIYVCLFNFNNCVTYLLNGLNKIRVQIITSVVFTLLYFIILYFIKGDYGVVGISAAMAIAYFFMSMVHLYQCNLILKNKAKGIWNK